MNHAVFSIGKGLAVLMLLAAPLALLSLPAGAQTMIDIARGNASWPQEMTVYDGRLYFGFEGKLWSYDAATGDARVVADPCSGACTNFFQEMTVYDGRLFFAAHDYRYETELWAYDAATGETRLVAERFGMEGEYAGLWPEDLTVLGDKLYFAGRDHENRNRLWYYDAAADSARQAEDPSLDWSSGHFSTYGIVAYDDRLFFQAQGAEGHELYFYDVARDTIALAADIHPGGGSSPWDLQVAGSVLFFGADDGTHGTELWTYDAAPGAARLAADVRPGALSSYARPLGSSAGTLFFTADDGTHGYELWRYEVATGQAGLVADLCPGACSSYPTAPVAYGDRVYFGAGDGRLERVLWAYDAATGQVQPALAPASLPPAVNMHHLTVYDGKLFFGALDVEEGTELWSYDAATRQAHRAADLSDEQASSYPWPRLVTSDGTFFFRANDGLHGQELWYYREGIGARRVGAAVDGAGWAAGNGIPAEYHGRIFFTATDAGHGYELWSADPKGGAATLAADICPGPCSGSPGGFVVYDGKLFFAAGDEQHGYELWSYDAGGARLEADIAPGADGSGPEDFIVYRDVLYFMADDGVHGRELWYHDAATGTSGLVHDLARGEHYQDLELFRLAVYDDRLYFVGIDSAGTGIWRYGPEQRVGPYLVPGKPRRLEGLPQVQCACTPPFFTAYDGRLFFRAYDEEQGSELWGYDANDGTARLIADLYPGSGGSVPWGETIFDDRLFFLAFGARPVDELWYYDGADDEVHRVNETLPLPFVSIGNVFGGGTRLYLQADDGVHGRELWYVTPYDLRRDAPAGPVHVLANAPNPFRDRTHIRFALFERSHVRVEVYDLLGRRVAVLVDGDRDEGMHEATFEAAGFPSGVYLYRFEAAGRVRTETMVLVR